MGSQFANRETDLNSPGRANGQVIAPDDNADHDFRFLTVVGSGTLSVELEKGGVVDYDEEEVAALGPWFCISVKRVRATGTSSELKIRGYN